MINELKPEEFTRIMPLIHSLPTEQTVTIQSVVLRNTNGRIFVDNVENPKTALVWVLYCMFYFLGDPENPDFIDPLPMFFKTELIPMNEACGCSCFITTLLEDHGWKMALDHLFQNSPVETGCRLAFFFDVKSFQAQNGQSGRLSNILPINQMMADTFESAVLRDNIQEFWPDFQTFLKQGIGYFYLSETNQIVSACFSVASAKGYQEIVINTYDRSDRQKGYASMVAQAYIKKCLKRKEIPVWNTYETNWPSVRIAEKMGFKLQAKQPYYELPFANFR